LRPDEPRQATPARCREELLVVKSAFASRAPSTSARDRAATFTDPRVATLTVMRSDAGYTAVLVAQRGEVVHAEPFNAVELEVGALFGADPR
jgi:hypothetical protein